MKRTFNRVVLFIVWLAVAGSVSPLVGDENVAAAIRLSGCRIKPADQITLSVNQSGVLESVPGEGDRVEAGQKVILLEDFLARAALAVAEKEAANEIGILRAEAASEVARLEFEQNIAVNGRLTGAVSLYETRRTKLEVDRCLLQIRQARNDQAVAMLKRDEAAAVLKTYYVLAPVAGTVNKVLKHKGETVRLGDPVVEVVNTSRVRVEGFLDAADRRRVTPGTVVHVVSETGAAGNGATSAVGKIVFVDPVVQPVTKQIRVWAEVDNADELLLPGLTAVMTIVPGTRSVAANRP